MLSDKASWYFHDFSQLNVYKIIYNTFYVTSSNKPKHLSFIYQKFGLYTITFNQIYKISPLIINLT